MNDIYNLEGRRDFGELKQVVSAPISEALLTVDSRDGLKVDSATGLYTNPRNPFDLQIYSGTQLVTGRCRRLKLKELNMTYNVPNVNPRNNVLFIQMSSTEDIFQIDVIPAFYLPEDLAGALQLLLNNEAGASLVGTVTPAGAVGGLTTWSVVWNSDSNTFTISDGNGSADAFRILPKLGQALPSWSVTPRELRTSTLAEMMGFNNCGNGYAMETLTSSYATMLYTTYIDVVSNWMTKNQYIVDRSTNQKTGNSLLARLYIAPERYYSVSNTTTIGTRPFALYKEWSNPKEINWDEKEPIASINIQLQDDKGNILYAPDIATPVGISTKDITCGNSGFVQMTFGVSEASGY